MISVIICSHNPREDYLWRTLEALKIQTLPQNQWELLLIDNASLDSIESRWDVSWHSHGRHVKENELGLTMARLKGIRESAGKLLIFVDDDNVLDRDYLVRALEVSNEWNKLGAWGGRIDPEYEMIPAEHLLPYMGMLAIRPVARAAWSNDPTSLSALPWGAGMCVRREVAIEYLREVTTNPLRKGLGRIGTLLGGCEDLDLAQTATQMGLGFGVFPKLRLLHLISKARVEADYLVRIHEGSLTTLLILNAVKGLSLPPKVSSIPRKVIERIRVLRMAPMERLMWHAKQRAYQSARKVCKKQGLGLSEALEMDSL